MDRGNCDPIDRLGVDIRDGALQYAGDSAVSIRGQVVGDGRVRVRLTNGNQSASGSGQLSASTGMAPVRRVRAPAAGRLNAAELAVAPVTMSDPSSVGGGVLRGRRRSPAAAASRRGRIRGRPMAFNVAATVTRCFEVLAI
jgi:hypothetical protein